MDQNYQEVRLPEKNCKDQLKDIKTNLILGDRRLATILLERIIPRIDNDLFLEHASFLLQNLMKNLETSNETDDQILCIRALNQMLIKVYNVNMPSLNRELSLSIIPHMIKRLMQFRSHEVFYAANCLSILSTLFPTLIAANRQSIEKRIFQLVDLIQQSENDNHHHDLLKLLGFCYCKIYLSGSTALMTRWREIISKLMNSLSTFAKHPIFSNVNKPIKVFTFVDSGPMEIFVMDNKSEYSLAMTKKLYFISATLCTLITGQFPIKLPLPVEAIIECLNTMVIISTPKFNQPSDGQREKEPNIRTSSIILQNVVIILRALIGSCRSNILCYSRLIIHIVNTTIEWIQQQPQNISSQSQVFLELQCSVLKCLADYFETLRLNTCFSYTEFEPILNFILEKISITESFSVNDSFVHTTTNNTIQSIRCINSLINNCSNLLDKLGWHKIQNVAIITLFQIYRRWFRLNHPYKNDTCRKELLETVRLILVNLDVANDVPLEAIINVLEEANRFENSVEIRQLTTSTIHLTNYVILSKISINNEMLLQSNTSETNEDSPILDTHANDGNFKNQSSTSNDQIKNEKPPKDVDKLIPSPGKQQLTTTIEIVNENIITNDEQQQKAMDQNFNQTSDGQIVDTELKNEKRKAFENDDDNDLEVFPSSCKHPKTVNETNENAIKSEDSNGRQQEPITITIEDSSDDDDEQTMIDGKKSKELSLKPLPKYNEDVDDIMKLFVE